MPDKLDEPLDVALCVAAAIEQVGGDYFVGGSVASSLQGDPRATNDIDPCRRSRGGGSSFYEFDAPRSIEAA